MIFENECVKTVAVQNIRYFPLNYLKQCRSCNVRNSKNFRCISANLKKQKEKFLKTLELVGLESILQEHKLLPKHRTCRFNKLYRNNTNWWETVVQRHSAERFKPTF